MLSYLPYNCIVFGHSSRAKSQTSGNNGRKSFRNGSNSQSNSDFEVIKTSFYPTSSKSLVIKVRDVHKPTNNTNNWDCFGKTFTEFINFLFQRRSFVFCIFRGFWYLLLNFTQATVHSSCNSNSDSWTNFNQSSCKNYRFFLRFLLKFSSNRLDLFSNCIIFSSQHWLVNH